MRSRLAVLLAAAAAVLAAAAPASADTFTLNSSLSVLPWHDAASWTDSPGGTDADGIPDTDDDVVINATDSVSPQVDLGAGSADVHTLTTNSDPLTGDGQTFISGADGTTLTTHADGALNNIELDGPSLDIAGGAVTAAGLVAVGFTNNTIAVDDGGTLTLGDPENGRTAWVQGGWPAAFSVHDGGTLNIDGLWAQFNSSGGIEVDGGTLNLDGTYPLGLFGASITADAASTVNVNSPGFMYGSTMTVAGYLNLNGDGGSGAVRVPSLNVLPTGRVTFRQAVDGYLPTLAQDHNSVGGMTFAAGSQVALDMRPGLAVTSYNWPTLIEWVGGLTFNATVTGLRTSPASTYTYGVGPSTVTMGSSTLTALSATALDQHGAQPAGTTLTCQPGTYSNPRAAGSSTEFLRDATSAGTGPTHVISSADRGHTLTCVDHATDSDANVLDTASSNSVTVPQLPVASLGAHPSGPVRTVTDTAFSGADHYRCQLDGDSAAACTSPYRPTGLADGDHTIVVTGYNAQDEPEASPHTVAFTLDRVAPAVTATAPSGLVAPVSAAIAVSSDDPNATLVCDLDGVAVTPCSPRATVSLPTAGGYQFTVAATDLAGNRATKTITVQAAKAQDPVNPKPDPVNPKPDPVKPSDSVKPVIKPTSLPLPNITDPAAPATCPAISTLEQTGASWLAADGASSATLTAGSPAGIWRCMIRGTEHGAPVEYRSLPVLVTGHQRAMLTAETATAATLKDPRLLSTGRQRISARLYRRVKGTWKIGPRSTRFEQTVRQGANTIAFVQHLAKPLPKGRYKLVVRVYTAKHTISGALVQELTIA